MLPIHFQSKNLAQVQLGHAPLCLRHMSHVTNTITAAMAAAERATQVEAGTSSPCGLKDAVVGAGRLSVMVHVKGQPLACTNAHRDMVNSNR
jgi:hypothetical protein